MIEAIIHVHNRVQHLERAVKTAVRSAAMADVLVRISSNANDGSAREVAAEVARQQGIEIIYSRAVSALDHLRDNVERSNASHVCLLHDDDFVQPNYFLILEQLIASNPTAAAYAPDVSFLIGSWLHQASFSTFGPFLLSPRWLALLYLMGRCGPPFPCITYRHDFASKAFARSPVFGKYTDTVIVLEAAQAGLWVHPEPAFTYVIGLHNDSRVVDEEARRRLRKWLLRQMLTLKSDGPPHFLANLYYFLGRFIKRHQCLS